MYWNRFGGFFPSFLFVEDRKKENLCIVFVWKFESKFAKGIPVQNTC